MSFRRTRICHVDISPLADQNLHEIRGGELVVWGSAKNWTFTAIYCDQCSLHPWIASYAQNLDLYGYYPSTIHSESKFQSTGPWLIIACAHCCLSYRCDMRQDNRDWVLLSTNPTFCRVLCLPFNIFEHIFGWFTDWLSEECMDPWYLATSCHIRSLIVETNPKCLG